MVKSVVDVYLEIANANPPWTAEEERRFISTCTTKTGKWKSNAAKERFVNEALKHNLGLVFSIVKKFAFRKNEDVIQRAVFKMAEALKKYDPRRKGKISTWITNPIKWAILQFQNTYAKSGTIAEELASLNHKFKMKMSVVSVDMPIGRKEDGDTIGSFISESSLNLHYAMDRSHRNDSEVVMERDMQMEVQDALDKVSTYLSDRENYVVRGFLAGKTQTDISKELHLSKVRISQLQASAFDKIRSSPMSSHLKRLLK